MNASQKFLKKVLESSDQENDVKRSANETDNESSSDESFDFKKKRGQDFSTLSDSDSSLSSIEEKSTPIELGELIKLECPFKNDNPERLCKLTEKQKHCHHDFRMHMFFHYRDSKDWIKSHWDERIKNLEKGDQLSMYCDMCSIRKEIKATTEKGLRNSIICHLAVTHGELRIVLEKDYRLTKDFVKSVYYDLDLKKLEESGAQIDSSQLLPEKPVGSFFVPRINPRNLVQDKKIKKSINPPKDVKKSGPEPNEIVTEKQNIKEPLPIDGDLDEIPDISDDESRGKYIYNNF